MPEPARPRLRHITMLRMGAIAVRAAVRAAVLAVVLAGCGSAEQGSGDAARSEPTPSTSTSTQACAQETRSIGRADLDGDGTKEAIEVASGGGETCPDVLAVAGGTRDPLVGAELPAGQPPVRSAYAVQVPGREGELLVTRQDHPRGGFQLRVYAAGDGRLVELEVDGQALVPFIALDVQEHPLSIDCTDGGVAITEAVAHEPPGDVAAWDVRRTSYAVEGAEVTAGATEEIAEKVLPDQLGARYPDLVRHAAFTSCRVSG